MWERNFKTKKGFTLIELLVVIAIIGILAGIILTALGGARATARDAKRIVELRSIHQALELYFIQYGSYPDEDTCDTSIGSGPNQATSCTTTNCDQSCAASVWDPYLGGIHNRLVGTGLSSDLPVDPINGRLRGRLYIYRYEPVCNQTQDLEQGQIYSCPSNGQTFPNRNCCAYRLSVNLEQGNNVTFRIFVDEEGQALFLK